MTKRSDGRWQQAKTIGGQRIYFYSSEKTEKAAKKDIENQMLAYAQQELQKITFGGIADEWIAYKERTVGKKTFLTYRATLQRMKHLYPIDVRELQPGDVQAIINNLYTDGLSKTILLRVRSVTSMLLDYAIGKNIRVQNFCAALTIPKNARRQERDAISDDEIEIIRQNAHLDFGIYPLLLLYTGCRRGEALALQWQDINFKTKTIHICKAIEFANAKGAVKLPKTQSGIRTVPLLDVLAEQLSPGRPEEYIFGGDRTFSETMINRRWKKYLKATGLDITQHQLRHTYATILYRAHIDAKTAQKLLGHSDVETTLNIYTHISESIAEQSFQTINSFTNK